MHHRRGQLYVESSPRIDRPGTEAGWDLCGTHQRAGGTAFGRRYGAHLQESGRSGTGLSLSERDRSVGAADSASHRGPCAGTHFSLRVGLLRGMASAPGLGAAAVRGRAARRTAQPARSGSTCTTVGLGTEQEALPSNCKWSSRAQLRRSAQTVGQSRSSHFRTQTAKDGGENTTHYPAGAGANTATSPGLRIDPDVPSNRKVNLALSPWESAEYSFPTLRNLGLGEVLRGSGLRVGGNARRGHFGRATRTTLALVVGAETRLGSWRAIDLTTRATPARKSPKANRPG